MPHNLALTDAEELARVVSDTGDEAPSRAIRLGDGHAVPEESAERSASIMTDGGRRSGLRARVEMRRRDLQAAKSRLHVGEPDRVEVEQALDAIDGLLTGDLDNLPKGVAAELTYWLESNRHLAERTPR